MWPPMAARRVVFRVFWQASAPLDDVPHRRRLPTQKMRKDDHTYHPIVIEGTGDSGMIPVAQHFDDLLQPRPIQDIEIASLAAHDSALAKLAQCAGHRFPRRARSAGDFAPGGNRA